MKDQSKKKQVLIQELVSLRKRIAELEQSESERKRVEEALREHDIQLKKLTSWVPGMIYQFTRRPDGTYCVPFTTEAIKDIFGCSPQDVREDFSPIARVILPEDFDKVVGSIEYSAKHLTIWTCEYRVQIPGQSIRWLLGNSTPEKLADGSITWYGFNTDITERKQAEIALRKNEEKYCSIIEHALECIFQTTPEGRHILVNPAFASMFGYDSPEDVMRSVVDIERQIYAVPEQGKEYLRLLGEKGMIKNYEAQMRRKDGSFFWVSMNARVVRDDAGNPLYYEGFAIDITERKQAEDRLRESELRYRELFENMWSGVSVYETRNDGEDFIFKDYNAAAEILDKTPREQAIGRSVVDVFPRVKDFGLFDVFQRVYRTGKSKRHPLTFYKDERISGWRENYVYKLPSGEIVAVFEDITEYKQAEEALRKSEENFRRSMDVSPLGVRIVTEEGETIYANRAILDIYGYDNIEELRTTPLKERYTPESYAGFQIRREKRRRGDHEPSEYDISIVRKDGEIRHLHVFRKEILWDGERQFQVLYNDITERRKAAEALRQSEERFRLLFENMIEGVALHELIYDVTGKTTDYRILNANSAYEIQTGISVERARGSLASELYGTGNPPFLEEYTRVSHSGVALSFETYFPPLEKHFIISVISHKRGQFATIFLDITKRKRMEEALRQSEELHRVTIENILDPIFITDFNGKFTFICPNVPYILGYSIKEIEAMGNIGALLGDPLRLFDLEELNKEGKITNIETMIAQKDGIIRDYLVTVKKVSIQSGTILYVCRDITERKRAEEALKASHQQLRALAGRLQSVREEQRKEIAREIHDQLGGAMAGLKIDLSFLASSAPKSWHITKRDSFLSKVHEMSKLIDETIATVRRIVTELRPSILDDFGILAALEWQLWEFQKRTGIQGEFVSTMEDVNIDEELSITVFRIFQEALTNVARHAKATNVIATLNKEADSLVLKVEDNGIGINADDINNAKSIGLIGMRERALFLGGTVTFSGEPSKGTTVSVKFPFRS